MFDKLKAGFAAVKEQKAITVPIGASALNSVLQKYPIEAIDTATITLKEGVVFVSGTTKIKKLGFSKELTFELQLKPVHAEKRTLQFELIAMKPMDFNQINKRVLQRPPVVTYNDRTINVDLNAIDIVSKIPIGNIQQFEAREDKIYVTIGL